MHKELLTEEERKIVQNVRELFRDPTKWTQCANARSLVGAGVHSKAPQAVSWCIWGALFKLSPNSEISEDIGDKIEKFLPEGHESIVELNDFNPYEVVMAWLDKVLAEG